MSSSTSCPIPGGREGLPNCYSTTPGGTLYATTPRRHQDHLRPKVPAGVQELAHCPDASLLPSSDSRGHGSSNSPTPKLEELTEQKETEEEIPDDAQFEMDI